MVTMKLRIIAVGKVKNRALQELAQDYLARISHYAKIDVVELKDSDPRQEGRQMLEKIERTGSAFVIALSEEGKEMVSGEFADRLGKINTDIIFLIGGPVGLSKEARKRADTVLSLSRMTFTHEMARVVLLEQVYRAFTILKGEKYHK